MNRYKFGLSNPLVHIVLVMFLLIGHSICGISGPSDEAVVMDLSATKLGDGKVIGISGYWELYPHHLFTPNDFKEGKPAAPCFRFYTPGNLSGKSFDSMMISSKDSVTYHVKLRLPPGLVSTSSMVKMVGLYFQEIRSSYTLWINGKEILRQGNIHGNPVEFYSPPPPHRVMFSSETDTVDLVLAVSNFTSSKKFGIIGKINIGSEEEILAYINMRRFFYIFSLGVFLMTAIYHLFLFLKGKAKNVNLSFGLLTLVLAIQSLVENERVISYLIVGINPDTIRKIWLLTLNFLPLMFFFYQSLYPKETSKKVVRWTAIVSAALSFLILILPYHSFAAYTDIVYFAAIAGIVYLCYISLAAIRNHRAYAGLTFAGMIIPFLFGINDLLNALDYITTGYYLPIAFLIYAVFQSYILTTNISNAYDRVEILTGELKNINDSLEKKVEERTEELGHINKALKEANSAKDKFLSILSHDLKNPFNVISGYTQLLRDNMEVLNKKDVKQILNNMSEAIGNTNKLLENLLDWTRLQLGMQSPQSSVFFVKPLLESTISNFIRSAEMKGILITVEAEDSCRISADQKMIETILRNLLSNAVKFTNEKGKIDITLQSHDDHVEIKIKDSGIGMDPDTLSKLFSIAGKGSRAGTANETGTGLGLILVKEFVDRNQGTITVSSNPGTGSIFTVAFPQAG